MLARMATHRLNDDRTEKGRTERKKDGKHRSSTVTSGHHRTLQNDPSPGMTFTDQVQRVGTDDGSIPPSSTKSGIYQVKCTEWTKGSFPRPKHWMTSADATESSR